MLIHTVRTVAAPSSVVVRCGGLGSSCARLWYCTGRVVCLVLFLLCVCVRDLFLFYITPPPHTHRSRYGPQRTQPALRPHGTTTQRVEDKGLGSLSKPLSLLYIYMHGCVYIYNGIDPQTRPFRSLYIRVCVYI